MRTLCGAILAATMVAFAVDAYAVQSDAARMGATAMNPGSRLGFVERIDGCAFRVLVYGNSIALHGPKADIGWTNNWGMAASAPEKDFAHLVVFGLEAKLGKKADFRIRNLAVLERNFTTNIATVAEISADAAWKPDYVVIAIGENVPNIDSSTAAAYRKFLADIARPFADAGSRVAMRSPFWKNDAKAACTKEAAAEVGAVYVDAGHLGANAENKAIGLFTHSGVANHPGDLGMRRIADLILESFAAPRVAIPSAKEMRGPFPIMSTPYFEDGAVDYDVLAREAQWTDDCGCPGVIWCQSNDAIDLLTTEEKFRGFEACAAAVEGRKIVLALGADGTNTTEMLEIAAEIERVAERHPRAKIAMISRPPDDARSQEDIERAWDELGRLSKRPVIFQTYGTKDTPTPSVELIVRLAERHPHAFGYVKEEASGWEANERMLKEVAAKPAMKTVFAGWGGWQWLLQLRHCGSEGLVTERCAYAPILGEIWRRYERGERGLALTEAFAMYRLLVDQRNMPGGLRGYSLYLLCREGVFKNMVSRQYEKANVTEGGSFGAGRRWRLETVKLNDIQKKELDLLYDDMIEFSGKGREK